MTTCDVTDSFQSCSDSGRRRLCGVMTHSYVCHDSFMCAPWLLHVSVPWPTWHDPCLCVMWLIHSNHAVIVGGDVCVVAWLIWICVLWLILVTHSYVCHDSRECVIYMCHSCDSFICVPWLIRVTIICVPWLILVTQIYAPWLTRMRHLYVSFLWFICMCAMTHSCEPNMCAMAHSCDCHDSFWWLICMCAIRATHFYMCHDTHINYSFLWLIYVVPWHTFKWLILVTRLYAFHDTHINDSFLWLIHSNHTVQDGVAANDVYLYRSFSAKEPYN